MRTLLTLLFPVTLLSTVAWAQQPVPEPPSTAPEPSMEQPATPTAVHWEIMSNDAVATRTFYQTLFGWQPMVWEQNPDYAVIPSSGEGYGIAGGIGQIQGEAFPPYLTVYVEVADLDQRVAQVGALGGTVVVPPMAIPGIGRMALFTDPGGTMLGMLESVEMTAPMPPMPPAANPVVHWEVGTHDSARVREFYTGLFGWTFAVAQDGHYAQIGSSSPTPISGGIIQMQPEVPPYVSIYVAVPDPQATLDEAQSLGAMVVMPPTQVMEGMTAAMFVDPQGFAIGLLAMNPVP